MIEILNRSPLLNAFLVLGGNDVATVDVWDAADGQLLFTLCGHTDAVTAIEVIKPTLIVTGSADTTIRMWDLWTAKNDVIFKGHKAKITSIEYLWNDYLV